MSPFIFICTGMDDCPTISSIFVLREFNNLFLTEKSSGGHNGEFYIGRAENLENGYATNEQLERCCGKHGICSHEVLLNGEADSQIQNKLMRKVAFLVQRVFSYNPCT